jgi:hypothetical protein
VGRAIAGYALPLLFAALFAASFISLGLALQVVRADAKPTSVGSHP